MPTRVKRPPFWRPLVLSLALVAFQAYLGYSAVNGQFGIESQKAMQIEISLLESRANALQAEIEAYKHRAGLFTPTRLDPDILAERAQALLNLARPSDVVVMVDAESGLPISGSLQALAADELTSIIEASPE